MAIMKFVGTEKGQTYSFSNNGLIRIYREGEYSHAIDNGVFGGLF